MTLHGPTAGFLMQAYLDHSVACLQQPLTRACSSIRITAYKTRSIATFQYAECCV